MKFSTLHVSTKAYRREALVTLTSEGFFSLLISAPPELRHYSPAGRPESPQGMELKQ